jgi:hypothetical protein
MLAQKITVRYEFRGHHMEVVQPLLYVFCLIAKTLTIARLHRNTCQRFTPR